MHSSFFRAMFYADFSEKQLSEVPLNDVDLDEFIEFLNVLYPVRKQVSGRHIWVLHLLRSIA